MKKNFITLLLSIFFINSSFAEDYYFNNCELSNAVSGNYVINLDSKIIEVTLKSVDGTVQNFSDKIKFIEENEIISEKIESGRGDEIYFEYYLNTKSKMVTKLQYKKQSGIDLDIFKLQLKKESFCSDIKGGWNKDQIEKNEIKNEQEQIVKAQKKIKKEQSTLANCMGDDPTKWTNCKGLYKEETGHKYEGFFKNGEIISGSALYSGGAKYVGSFKSYQPDGYGSFLWANGDKYFGDWKDGKTHGNGTKIWTDGREYTGAFKNDKLHGDGMFYYPDGKRYDGEFLNCKRHGQGTFTYPDGTSFIGKFIAGIQDGLGTCIALDGSALPCQNKSDVQATDFSGKDTRKVSIVAKKWVRVSQYEANSKKGKKIMDKLKADFEMKAKELCASKGNYNVLQKRIEVLDLDDTPAYGLETKLQIGINGIIECI